ncbi:protein of unknown function [endosymbiont DhMRE of Dentiscutata heterogama]|uniref:hypothetical protein n=1 Tax=endosymbiont DhMRE of Dentiscutata heterogama TaxID=1609546 RepID=UPI000629D9BC|nr:hypothetical protein [endosymbiont DhMRE of Dentiscutata heterogama]CFW92990.1 protein of unknown function [endosymbiont DhMRE of Dentiscutata heterogama]
MRQIPTKKGKKWTILGGEKVSSRKLSEWGRLGGRPRKWTNEAERKKWMRQQKALSEGRELRAYRSYGEVQIKSFGKCSNCGRKYSPSEMLEKIKFGSERLCWTCAYSTVEQLEQKIAIGRAGSNAERIRRSREKKEDDEEDEEEEE